MSDKVCLPKKELIEEHEHLIGVLKDPSHKQDKKEAKKQQKELSEYRKKSDMDKREEKIIEVAPDGKSEIVPGKEPLKKEPKKKDSMIERWDRLKKALDNAKAILDLKAESQADEEPEAQPEEAQQAQDQAQPQGEAEQQDEQQGEQQPDAQSAPAEEAPEEQEPAQQSEEDQQEENPADDDDEAEKIAASLKDQGYSDAEIAYVVHGHHAPEIDVAKDAKAKATQAMSGIDMDSAKSESQQKLEAAKMMADHEMEHKKRMSDLEYNKSSMDMPDPESDKKHKQRMSDLEYEAKRADMPNPQHKRRMEDVEYDSAKASMPNNEFEMEHKKKMLELEYNFEKEAKKLELEFKKKEHIQKLKLAEDGMKQKKAEGEAKHKIRLSEAKKPKPKTPLKKSDDEAEEVDGQPYDGDNEYHELCDDESCDRCFVDGEPYSGEEELDSVEKDDMEDAPYSKRNKQIQRYKNQGADARTAQRAGIKPQVHSSVATPYAGVPNAPAPALAAPVSPAPAVPKIPNTVKTDSDDPSHTPSFDNKAKRNLQRHNRRDAVAEEKEVPHRINVPVDVKVPYIDIGTRPTPATPKTHPKLR